MAQIALPRQQVAQAPQSVGVGSPLYQRRRTSNAGPIELIPNPDFTFPQRAPEPPSSEPSTVTNVRPMSLQAYPTSRRGSTPGMRQKSVSALPDFSFNPSGASQGLSTGTTPPHSPMEIPTTPSRPIGHRRGGSEFIGGDGRSGGVNLMSTSPTKGDGVLPAPNTTLRPGPPAGRRGHAHRRSGAISSHDVSSMMRPSDPTVPPRAGSAPATPMEGEMPAFGHSVNKSVSQPSLRGEISFFPEDPNSSPRRPPSRARVGFSDKVEYIRPLSTISSETETSLSTVRCHSATGSLSSVISAGTSSPQSARMGRPSLNTTLENEERPSTAGAVLDKHKNGTFGSDLFSRKRPMSAISPASPTAISSPISPRIPAKRRGFFRLESRRSDPSIRPLQSSASDPALSGPSHSPLVSPMRDTDSDEAPEDSEKSKSSSRKSSRKPRKVKSWANSIISRKGKHSNKPNRRAPTPPPESTADAEDTDGSDELDFEANFDDDNTVTIVSPNENTTTERKVETDIASWKPREFKRVDSDSMSPVIDLDAALGPFNTPQGSNQRGQQRGFAAHRRAMHSAGGILQSHRRTESAPELAPFELRPSTVGAPATMADVFEEEEPEEDISALNSSPTSPASVPEEAEEDVEEPKIQVVEADEVHNGSKINWNFNDGLGIKRDEKARRYRPCEPVSPHEFPNTKHPMLGENGSKQSVDASPVEVVEDYEEPRTSSLTHSSDSTVTPPMPADETKGPQPVMNLALPLPQQSLMTPDTFTSSFSSPDFRSSQTSFDTPRLGTAASSVTDYRAMPSPHFGEPGPEVRISVDDVPSLTSSRSTMTSGMHNAFSMMSPRQPGDRSASLCSIPSDIEQRRRKRSSIASLSRLINGSSFGEKSKLSIEQRPQSEYLEPTKESKKKH
ncbi:uncharacterized protein BDR25DRAFT_186855, partial [Lindgomyces ingoldianus]